MIRDESDAIEKIRNGDLKFKSIDRIGLIHSFAYLFIYIFSYLYRFGRFSSHANDFSPRFIYLCTVIYYQSGIGFLLSAPFFPYRKSGLQGSLCGSGV